jgi:hypothetical protein
MPTWFDDCRFILHYEHHSSPDSYPHPLLGYDRFQVQRLLERVRPDAVQYYAKGNTGYAIYPTRFDNRLPGLADNPEVDLLGSLREITRELGIHLVVAYSGLIDFRAAEWRPGWLRIKSDYNAYPNRALCVNSGYVDELLLPQLDELLTRYEPDGLWMDAENWTVSPCYCSACESEYQMLSERSAPTSRQDSMWSDWLEFHRDSFERYLIKVGKFTHDRLPQLVYASNGTYATHQPDNVVAGPDRLSRDLSPAYSLRQAGLEARGFDARGLPFDLMTWNRTSARPWAAGRLPALPAYPKTLDHLAQEGAVILANGGRWSVWMRTYSDDALPEAEHDAVADAAAFTREVAPWALGTRSGAYVAVLHTETTHRAAGNGLYDPGPSLDRIRGVHQMLLELHHPHDVVGPAAFQEDAERYQVVILPEQIDLSTDLEDFLVEWVRKGGRLIASGRVSPRIMEDIPTFALEEVLGIRWTGGRDQEGYIQHRGAPLQIGAPIYHVALHEADLLSSLLISGHEQRQQSTGLVGISRFALGAGLGFYISAELFAGYHRTQYPGLREVLEDVLTLALSVPPLLTTASPTVEITLRERDGERIIHLVEHNPGTSLAQNHPFVENVPLTPAFTLTVAVPAQPTQILLQPGDEPAEWSYAEGTVTVCVPEFKIHTAVAITLPPSVAPETPDAAVEFSQDLE